MRVTGKRISHCLILWKGLEATSLTKGVVGEPRMNLTQTGKRFPRGLFADRYVRILRLHGGTLRGIHDANRESRADEGVQNAELVLGQWECAMISRDHVRRSTKGIFFSQNRIGSRDREFRDRDA